MTRRMFVAVLPPPEVLDELLGAVQPWQAEAAPLKWAPPEAWHLTLAFLGAVEQPRLDLLVAALEEITDGCAPLRLSVAGAGRFGDRVLWAGIAGDRESLRRLADSVRSAAGRCGIKVDPRPYRGHLTLARGSTGADLRPLAERLRHFTGSPWTATELYLIESRLGAGGDRTALHETYAHWPLRGQR